MNYLKFTSYAYIIAGILFAIEAFNQYQSGEKNQAILMGIIAASCVFLFFFRRNFAKKFQERNKKP
jgi:cytochrome c biogenesis protein CcdA